MKSASVLTRLVTVLTATMLTICPVALPAADDAPDALRAPEAESGGAPQCPLPQRAAPARRTTSNSSRDMSSGPEAPAAPSTGRQASEQSDLSDALLEDLVMEDR